MIDCINYWLSLVHWKLSFIGTCRAHFGFIEMPFNYKLAVDIRCFWWTENMYLTCGKLHGFPYLSCRWLYMDALKKWVGFFPLGLEILSLYIAWMRDFPYFHQSNILALILKHKWTWYKNIRWLTCEECI